MSNPTAAIIIIGNEILSGRTQDLNIQYIAQKLSSLGIKLNEVRIIGDYSKQIINTIIELKDKYNYIFTTGGIGPTHDDITSQAIADCFGVELEKNPIAYELIKEYYISRGQELNSAREKMAYIPKGSSLIYNPISGAPGFIIENIYVMAGVPHIMQAMFEEALPTLQKGEEVKTKQIDVMIAESTIAEELTTLQNKYPQVEIGSYPFEIPSKQFGTSLVLRSVNLNLLDSAYSELQTLIKKYI